MVVDDLAGEKQAILDIIEDETTAFFERDFERYAGHWLHSEGVHRLVTLAGGQIICLQGWQAEAAMTNRLFRDHPKPNPQTAAGVVRENVRIRIGGDMAWASFDQYVPATDDVIGGVGLSHHVRIFEKHQEQWKIVHVGHADTILATLTCPTVRVSAEGVILWMNAAARDQLDDHPVLVKSGSHLLARTRDDNKLLRSALKAAANLSPLDVRRMGTSSPGALGAKLLVLGEVDTDRSHLIWVKYQDQMFLVSFNDPATERQRLAAAKSVYGLSKAQMRLAALIVEGYDMVKAAENMAISATTARTHLQRIYDKTGVRSQTALVRTLLSASVPTS